MYMCVLAYIYVWESEEGIRSSEAGVRLLVVAMCVLEPWSLQEQEVLVASLGPYLRSPYWASLQSLP